MEEKPKKNEHWCADIFPPTYTSKDILDVSDKETLMHEIPLDIYSNIYKQVILEETIKKKENPQRKKHVKFKDQMKEKKNELDSVFLPNTMYNEKSFKNGSLWSAEELQVFNEAYSHLKEKATKLLCIVESRNLKVSDLKVQNKELKKELKQKDETLSDVMKENTILKGYAKTHEKLNNDIESKLQFYEECNNDLKQIIQKKDKELVKRRAELENECKLKKYYYLSARDLKERHINELALVDEANKSQYECQLSNLKKELDDIVTSKSLAEEKCTQYKRAFLDLQEHFMKDSMGSCVKLSKGPQEKDFLGIADIDYSRLRCKFQ